MLTQQQRQEGLAEEKLFSHGRIICVRAQTLIIYFKTNKNNEKNSNHDQYDQ